LKYLTNSQIIILKNKLRGIKTEEIIRHDPNIDLQKIGNLNIMNGY
jgi:hypothetical protein